MHVCTLNHGILFLSKSLYSSSFHWVYKYKYFFWWGDICIKELFCFFIFWKNLDIILFMEKRNLIFENSSFIGYVWWSLFHGIAPMIWFYPLNELEISGYEAFVITILSPIFTGISMLLQFSGTIHGLAFWRVLSLVGVASFQAPTTLIRLVMLASGCGTAMLWFCGMIWSKDPKER